jgi:hypothetical protein
VERHRLTSDYEKKVDVLIAEFRRIFHESSHLLANPGLKKCRAIVELHPITRVPIRQNTKFKTVPQVLKSGYDAELLKLRNNALMEYLLEDRERIGAAWASGRTGYMLSLSDVIDPDAPRRCSVKFSFSDSNGRKAHFGLG